MWSRGKEGEIFSFVFLFNKATFSYLQPREEAAPGGKSDVMKLCLDVLILEKKYAWYY